MKKSYYAVIPANVRYDQELTPNAKLLYGEITALCNQEGYCWANNSYFAELYNVSNTTISKWISQLVVKGYITREINYKEGSREVDKRYLRISDHPIEEKDNTPLRKVKYPIEEKDNTPIEEKLKDNNTFINITNEYIYTLFEHWQSKDIIKHRSINQQMKSHINARLKDYTVDELKKAIDNYHTVLTSDNFYWTHTWTLQDFMRPNNVSRFVDDAKPLDNFKSNKKQSNKGPRLIKEVDF